MARRRLSEREVLAVLIDQCGTRLCCYRCKNLLWCADEVEREHIVPLALGGKDELSNMAYSHRSCHAEQTRRDKAQIAKADRQRLYHETGRGSAKKHVNKIQSRGFDKTLRKRMDGAVEKVS